MAAPQNIFEQGKKQAKRAFFTFVIPTSLKRAALYGVAWFALWPAAGAVMFPRAKAVMQNSGLRTEIVEQLAPDKTVYIRPQNLAGTAHGLLMGGPLAVPFKLGTVFNSGVQGATTNDLFRRATGVCGVTVMGNDAVTLLHEIRHCSAENERLLSYGTFSNMLAEGDADYHAINTLWRETGDARIKNAYLQDQAKLGRGTHDTALYLDALFNGRAAPPLAEMQRANREAEATYEPLMRKSFRNMLGDWACEGEEAKTCNYDLEKQGLSPLALQRAKMFEKAWQSSVEAALEMQKLKPSSQSKSSAPVL